MSPMCLPVFPLCSSDQPPLVWPKLSAAGPNSLPLTGEESFLRSDRLSLAPPPPLLLLAEKFSTFNDDDADSNSIDQGHDLHHNRLRFRIPIFRHSGQSLSPSSTQKRFLATREHFRKHVQNTEIHCQRRSTSFSLDGCTRYAF